ncbi:MAG: lysine--tRNA ligase [Candidatus Staskawiczbacteria bacterium RIFOXYD2_FULL_37_9]|uniref:Lysine--tRNA ligase n=1 Tax=Candidatus Staskawiczbacteria bacterium RIFOXYB1_FULL_37_44 TaxID=1802223 RepID=A0A1G2IW19_9BACT|nr:MAG: lysine--tRNA ligase [Candidatus Staskawiczbacteria bacterium RIFOXYB1_FULL_37_44]OGZ83597.1 MAG: lysine--tRNA ligase [Candidatus Staskawiczbacteria bacterium RIFOXYC1_FULL_37_52]OGZ88697.1 MAG: lysine--tRNA ligase [Candidatus Staskawiczbacteria bacterium RIFOXYD1_FULL_37_110]OGZ89036.1 MAG: lysine--tRNA ligase [Candidatus Staskawiczbacteria bacterium RIFOXYC2_FULL_37_19]OGZ93006.1 MAG: lysine--tRNA ligase [Candidatus Staskawiczbacteria bacterium RIFOXYD2_FULL_37_9]
MPTIEELRKIRVEKLKKLQDAGILAYPAKTGRTHSIAEALKNFVKFSKAPASAKASARRGKRIVLAGRIMALRGHGGATFLDINDGSGKIQVIIKTDKVGEKGYQFFLDVFDIGDFVEIKGTLFTTTRGEKTIEAEDYKMLSKSLLTLPEKWHGIQDVEEKLRKRYLDIIFNPEVKAMIGKRAIFWNSIREFLTKKEFLEVETPVLETTPGGADARPFITHHNALDIDVFLRISMGELWQKKLMVAGFEKTFEIGRQFRNEGMDAEHLQDYTQCEFYWAYADYEQGMKLVEEMYKYVAKKTFGTLKFKIRGFDVDLGKKWEKYDFQAMIAKHTGINIDEASLPEIEKTLQKLKIEYDKKGFNITRAIDNCWKYCRKNIAGPGFLINVPIVMEPLAKKMEKNPKLVQRFQVILAGSENGKGYSELNDPLDQAERFAQQQKFRDAGDQEAQRYDKDFIEALEYGMPPTCGFGVSERLFSFLMDKPSRDCQIFPLMKPK